MNPELVAGLEVRDGGDREGDIAARDANVNLGTFKIEASLGLCHRAGAHAEQKW
jgi:hypothetical protein